MFLDIFIEHLFVFSLILLHPTSALNSKLESLLVYQDLSTTSVSVPSKTFAVTGCESFVIPDGYKYLGCITLSARGSVDTTTCFCVPGRIAESMSRVLIYNASTSAQTIDATIRAFFIKD